MAELEVPSAGEGRRNDLRPLDAHSEAPARRRRTHRHRRLAGGRPHRRWRAVRGGRGRGKRQAEGPRRAAARDRLRRPAGCSPAAAPRPPHLRRVASCRRAAGGRRSPNQTHGSGEDGRAQAPPKAKVANEHGLDEQRTRPACQPRPRAATTPIAGRRSPVPRAATTPIAGRRSPVGCPDRRPQPSNQAPAKNLEPVTLAAAGGLELYTSLTGAH